MADMESADSGEVLELPTRYFQELVEKARLKMRLRTKRYRKRTNNISLSDVITGKAKRSDVVDADDDPPEKKNSLYKTRMAKEMVRQIRRQLAMDNASASEFISSIQKAKDAIRKVHDEHRGDELNESGEISEEKNQEKGESSKAAKVLIKESDSVINSKQIKRKRVKRKCVTFSSDNNVVHDLRESDSVSPGIHSSTEKNISDQEVDKHKDRDLDPSFTSDEDEELNNLMSNNGENREDSSKLSGSADDEENSPNSGTTDCRVPTPGNWNNNDNVDSPEMPSETNAVFYSEQLITSDTQPSDRPRPSKITKKVRLRNATSTKANVCRNSNTANSSVIKSKSSNSDYHSKSINPIPAHQNKVINQPVDVRYVESPVKEYINRQNTDCNSQSLKSKNKRQILVQHRSTKSSSAFHTVLSPGREIEQSGTQMTKYHGRGKTKIGGGRRVGFERSKISANPDTNNSNETSFGPISLNGESKGNNSAKKQMNRNNSRLVMEHEERGISDAPKRRLKANKPSIHQTDRTEPHSAANRGRRIRIRNKFAFTESRDTYTINEVSFKHDIAVIEAKKQPGDKWTDRTRSKRLYNRDGHHSRKQSVVARHHIEQGGSAVSSSAKEDQLRSEHLSNERTYSEENNTPMPSLNSSVDDKHERGLYGRNTHEQDSTESSKTTNPYNLKPSRTSRKIVFTKVYTPDIIAERERKIDAMNYAYRSVSRTKKAFLSPADIRPSTASNQQFTFSDSDGSLLQRKSKQRDLGKYNCLPAIRNQRPSDGCRQEANGRANLNSCTVDKPTGSQQQHFQTEPPLAERSAQQIDGGDLPHSPLVTLQLLSNEESSTDSRCSDQNDSAYSSIVGDNNFDASGSLDNNPPLLALEQNSADAFPQRQRERTRAHTDYETLDDVVTSRLVSPPPHDDLKSLSRSSRGGARRHISLPNGNVNVASSY